MASQKQRNMPLEELMQEIEKVGKQWVETRRGVIKQLRQMVIELGQINRDVRIAKTTGAVASIVGGGLAIGGFAASFVTFGASLVLGIVGTAIAGSGGVTGFGASIGEMFQKRRLKKTRNKLMKKDHQLVEELLLLFDVLQKEHRLEMTKTKIEDMPRSLKNFATIALGTVSTGASVKTIVETGIKLAAGVGDDVALTVFMATSPLLRAVHIAGGVASIVLLPYDIHTLVKHAKALALKEECELSQEFADLADDLEKNLHQWVAMLQ